MESFTEKNIPNESGKIPLTVILKKSNDCWIAQGIQIDYVAYGKTVEDAKSNFEEGLMLTLEDSSNTPEALEMFLKNNPIPDSVLEKYLALKTELVEDKDDSYHEKFDFDFLKAAA